MLFRSPPELREPPVIAHSLVLNRGVVAGGIQTGTLRLGTPSTEKTATVPPQQSAAFVTMLQPDGSYLQEVTMEIQSEFGGADVKPKLGVDTYLRGETVLVSAPSIIYEDALGNRIDPNDSSKITASAVVRRTCVGFEV